MRSLIVGVVSLLLAGCVPSKQAMVKAYLDEQRAVQQQQASQQKLDTLWQWFEEVQRLTRQQQQQAQPTP